MKKKHVNKLIALCATFILISFDANASAEPPSQPNINQTETSTLPQSINSCVGKNEGDNCTFNQNDEKILGKCERNKEGKMNCTMPNT